MPSTIGHAIPRQGGYHNHYMRIAQAHSRSSSRKHNHRYRSILVARRPYVDQLISSPNHSCPIMQKATLTQVSLGILVTALPRIPWYAPSKAPSLRNPTPEDTGKHESKMYRDPIRTNLCPSPPCHPLTNTALSRRLPCFAHRPVGTGCATNANPKMQRVRKKTKRTYPRGAATPSRQRLAVQGPAAV